MILINGEVTKIDDVIKRFNVPIEKLKKHSVFLLNPALRGFALGETQEKRGVPQYYKPKGKQYPASFTSRDAEGNDVEVRFAKTRNKRQVGDRLIDVYDPRNVRLDGIEDIPSSIDESVYMYLYPRCYQSPFRNGKQWAYRYQDVLEEADEKMQSFDIVYQAMTHAQNIDGKELALFAKGLGIEGIDRMETKQVRVKLAERAMNDPVTYMAKAKSQTTLFDGRVADAIDKGVFVLKPELGIFRWAWGKGPKEGSIVVDIMNKNEDSRKILMEHIKQNINDYYEDILSAHKSITANIDAERFLQMKEGSIPVKIDEPIDANIKIPSDFNGAKEYLTNMHPQNRKPSTVKIKEFREAVEAGEITKENVHTEAMKYISSVQ